MKRMNSGSRRASLRRAAPLAAAITLALTSAAVSQTADEQKKKDEAVARIGESYGVMLDTISVYADRNARQLLDLPQNVTVIGRQELDERMVRDVQDLVRYQPGINVSKITSSTDPFGNMSGFTIRGVSNNRVQMLIDGTRITESIQDGNRDFINMANLKAVEIIRGPAGVMWGADALGGVVAFVTKDPEDYLKGRKFGGQLDTSYDSYDHSFIKTTSTAVRFGDFSALISASQRSYNEGTLSKARADGGIYGCPRTPQSIRCNQLNPVDGDDYDILGKLVWSPNKEHEVKFTTEFVKRDTTVDQKLDLGQVAGAAAGTTQLSYIRNQIQTRDRYTLNHRYTPELGWLDQIRWQISHSPQERDFTGVRLRRLPNTNLQRLDYKNDYKEKFTEGDIQMNSSFRTFLATHKLTYGAYASLTDNDYDRREVTRNLTTGVITATNNAAGFFFADATTKRIDGYVQDEISFFNERLLLTPGVRYATYQLDPRPSQFYQPVPGNEPRAVQGEKLVKQFGSVFKLDQHVSLVGRYSEGFKMPTAQQLYTSQPNFDGANAALIPAPNLRPEHVKSYEIGTRAQFRDGFMSLTIFKADYTDFIQSFVEVPSINFPGVTDITYQNLASVKVQGVELAGEYRFNDTWSTNLSVAYTTGTQRLTANSAQTPFDQTTPISGVFGVRYTDKPNGFDAQLISTWSGEVLPRSAPTLYRADGYIVFDAITSWAPQWVPGLTLRASVLNIGDTRYFPSFNGTTQYGTTASTAVAIANPIELRTAPGRTFKVGANYAF